MWFSRPDFLRLIYESGDPVLDVACGTCHLLLDYMQEGVDIDGVDISLDMIVILREKAQIDGSNPNLSVQPIQELDLPRKYWKIIVPSSSFLHLVDMEDVQKALQSFYHHLEMGALLAMSMHIVDASEIEIDWEIDAEATRPSDGALARKWG